MVSKNEALKMAIEALEDADTIITQRCRIVLDAIQPAINACKEALEQPVCNPHPKAPHGFNRDASHSANRYVCECEGWQVEQPAQMNKKIMLGAIILLKSDNGENVEYDRALLECFNVVFDADYQSINELMEATIKEFKTS
jgi:hypothetical protein